MPVRRQTGSGHAPGGGFTLIEVLVVVAIIAILLAVLLPAVERGRALAKQCRCGANLKNIARAYIMYCDDNDQRLYQGAFSNYAFGGWLGYEEGLEPNRPVNAYLGLPRQVPSETTSARVFMCPGETGERSSFGSFYLDLGNSYQANPTLADPGNLRADASIPESWKGCHETMNGSKVRRISETQCRSELLWFGDHPWRGQIDPAVRRRCAGWWHGQWNARRHHHNMAFVDGHVALVHILKGLYVVRGDYRIHPITKVNETVASLQQQAPCACDQEP